MDFHPFISVLLILILGNNLVRILYASKDSTDTTRNGEFGISFNPNDIKFYIYNSKTNPNKSIEIKLGSKSSLQEAGLQRNVLIHIIVHGFLSSSMTHACADVRTAFLKVDTKNIICVDWSKLAAPILSPLPENITSTLQYGFYPAAVKSTKITGKRIGEFIKFLISNKIVSSPKKFHLIGHSLGSHVCGIAGLNVKKIYGQKIGRISGLDPAGPLYNFLPKSVQLDASDAKFVDVIHTDEGELGIAIPVGTVDFFANGGHRTDQPICDMVDESAGRSCAHAAAVDYFVRSILGEKFIGCRCKEFRTSLNRNGTCTKSRTCRQPTRFGEFGSLTAKGNFYLPVSEDRSNSSFLHGF